MLGSPVQAAPFQVASGAQLTSCTAWRQGAVAQAVQILKQTPEGSRWGLLDSPEHTDFSQPASRKPLLPLAGPGDVVLQPRLIWIRKRRELRAPARGLRTGTQALGHSTRSPGSAGDLVCTLRQTGRTQLALVAHNLGSSPEASGGSPQISLLQDPNQPVQQHHISRSCKRQEGLPGGRLGEVSVLW